MLLQEKLGNKRKTCVIFTKNHGYIVFVEIIDVFALKKSKKVLCYIQNNNVKKINTKEQGI